VSLFVPSPTSPPALRLRFPPWRSLYLVPWPFSNFSRFVVFFARFAVVFQVHPSPPASGRSPSPPRNWCTLCFFLFLWIFALFCRRRPAASSPLRDYKDVPPVDRSPSTTQSLVFCVVESFPLSVLRVVSVACQRRRTYFPLADNMLVVLQVGVFDASLSPCGYLFRDPSWATICS